MVNTPKSISRRRLLRYLATGSLASIAGCNQTPESSTSTSDTDGPSPTTTSTSTTSADNYAPEILSYEANPRNQGTVLAVSMEGRDDTELEEAAIVYGDQHRRESPDGKSVTLEGEFSPDKNTESPDRVTYQLRDVAGNKTHKEAYPDRVAPELDIASSATEDAGELELLVEGRDDVGLQELAARLNGETARDRNVSNAEKAAIDTILTDEDVKAIQPFARNHVTGTVLDKYDNATEKTVEQYVRKYDKMDDTRLDIGAIYISQQGNAFRMNCRDSYEGTHPAVGIYDEDPIPTEFSTKHIDQMTGHGINRLVYDYAGWRVDEDRVHSLMDSQIIDQVTVEPFLTVVPFLRNMNRSWKDDLLPRDLPPIRKHFFSRDNAATIDGRPVISTWNFTQFQDLDTNVHKKMMEEFDSYEGFVEEMRSHLRVDGTDPFIIVGKGPHTLKEGTNLADFVQNFDGLTTFFPGGDWREGGVASWDNIINRVETYFADNYEYATAHDMEFTPRVFPGLDHRGSGCRNTGKYIPRRPERFQQLLNIAERYATSDRIDISSWNEWTEGHQIEPGTFKGNEYGTAYLEVVEEFQRGD